MPRRGYDDLDILASAAQDTTFTTNNREVAQTRAVMYLSVTAVSGTNPTLDCEVFAVDPFGNAYSIGVFDRLTAVGNQRVELDPLLDIKLHVVSTIGGTDTPTFTMAIKLIVKEN